jgi:FecR protein
MMKVSYLLSLVCCFSLIYLPPVLGAPKVYQQTVVGRWLRVQAATGDVMISPPLRKAALRERLSKVGDRLVTGKDASAELWIDDGIGKLVVGEFTELRILRLEKLPNGAKRTHITITGGTVKLKLRKLLNPKSNVQIFTPAGTAAVRGTIFGVSLNRKGISGVAVQQGIVIVSGKNQKLPIRLGFGRILVPRQPPSKLRIIPETVRIFDIHYQHRGSSQVLLRANTDPGNLVQVAGRLVDIDAEGNFQALVPDVQEHLIPVQITTPLNNSKRFRLTILDSDLP